MLFNSPRFRSTLPLLLFILASTLLTGCHSSRRTTDNYIHSLVKAGLKLGFDIEESDNHALMLESARWMGVPYRYAGQNRRGVDCSGLTCAIYKEVYNVRLPRSSGDQYNSKLTRHVSKSNLRQGDLVFFSTPAARRKCGHVGIMLKGNLFIHASSSRGVTVSSLNEKYYKKHYLSARRLR